jgi:hypothetical protein
VRGRQFHALGNFDPLPNAIVGRHNEIAALASAELTDNSDVRTTEYPDDLAFGAALVSQARDVDERTIPMHAFRGFVGRKKYIALHMFEGLVGNQKSEAVTVN